MTMNRAMAGKPGWYVLTFRGEVIDQGEEQSAAFCIRAQKLGRGAIVEERQHPHHDAPPFGFHYSA